MCGAVPDDRPVDFGLACWHHVRVCSSRELRVAILGEPTFTCGFSRPVL